MLKTNEKNRKLEIKWSGNVKKTDKMISEVKEENVSYQSFTEENII